LKQSRLNLLRPTSIDIHVTTQSTSAPIPINLSSTFSSCVPYKPFDQEIKGIDIELGEQRGGHHKLSSIDSAISIVTEAELSTPAVKSSLPPPGIAYRSTQSAPLYLPSQQQNYLHTRNVLFLLFVAQLFILAAYSCFLSVFALNPALTISPTGVLALRILQVIFKVISVISTMSASFCESRLLPLSCLFWESPFLYFPLLPHLLPITTSPLIPEVHFWLFRPPLLAITWSRIAYTFFSEMRMPVAQRLLFYFPSRRWTLIRLKKVVYIDGLIMDTALGQS